VGRKDRLWQHLREMEEECDNGDFSIMPYTFVLPREAKRLKAYLSDQSMMRHIILKPVSCQLIRRRHKIQIQTGE